MVAKKQRKAKFSGSDKVLILLSGGPDSATLAKMAEREYKHNGSTLNAIYLKTGHPKDNKEMESANRVAQSIGMKLEIIDISKVVKALGGKVPTIHSEASIMRFGNSLVMSIALAYCFETSHTKVMIGLHGDDSAESREYTREYMDRIEQLAAFAYSNAPKILTPFLEIDKVAVFKLGKKIGVDYAMTWSCLNGEELHCGTCGACRTRRRAFTLAGIADPTNYEHEPMAVETAIA